MPVAERPLSGSLSLSPGGTDALPRRALRISCTAAGNVAMKLADDSVETVPVDVGLSILPYAVKAVLATGTTAVATYASLS